MSYCTLNFAIILTIFPNIGCWLLFFAVRNHVRALFTQIKVPKWALPGWTELPIWTIVYCSIGYASFLVYRDGYGFEGPAQIPLTLYGIQLFLNWSFIPLFFGRHKLKCSFYHLVLVFTEATICAGWFAVINPVAGALFVPYLVWNLYTTILTYSLYRTYPHVGLKCLRNEEFLKPELIINKENC